MNRGEWFEQEEIAIAGVIFSFFIAKKYQKAVKPSHFFRLIVLYNASD